MLSGQRALDLTSKSVGDPGVNPGPLQHHHGNRAQVWRRADA